MGGEMFGEIEDNGIEQILVLPTDAAMKYIDRKLCDLKWEGGNECNRKIEIDTSGFLFFTPYFAYFD